MLLLVGREEAEALGVDHAEHHHDHALLGPLLELALEVGVVVARQPSTRRADDVRDDRHHVREDRLEAVGEQEQRRMEEEAVGEQGQRRMEEEAVAAR